MATTIFLTWDNIYQLWVGGGIRLLNCTYNNRCLSMAITISLTLDKIYQLWVGGNICLLSFSYDRCLSMATTIDKIYQLWVRGGGQGSGKFHLWQVSVCLTVACFTLTVHVKNKSIVYIKETINPHVMWFCCYFLKQGKYAREEVTNRYKCAACYF